MLNLYRSLYFIRPVCLLLIFIGVMLSGCENRPSASALGSVAGMAQLSVPNAATGHAGVLMFLAGTPYQARTDQLGRYRIDGIPAGTYDLVAEKEGFQGQVIDGVLINPAEHTADSPLQPKPALLTKIETTATANAASATETGVIKGTVFLSSMAENENGGVRVEVNGTAYVAVTSNLGQYRLLNVDPGTYALSFYKDGYRPFTTEDVVVTTGVTEMPPVALELIQAGDPVSPASAAAAAAVLAVAPTPAPAPPGPNDPRSITGVVELKDAQGTVLTDYSGVTIAINGTDIIAEVNEQGQFRFDNLTSGTYTVIGTVQNGSIVQVPVDLETQRTAAIKVSIGPPEAGTEGGGTIKGRVVLVDPDDKPQPDSSGVQVAVNGTQSMATTTAEGEFTITGVAPGNYTITASRDTFENATVPNVAVNSAEPVDVGEIRLMMKVDRPRVLSTDPVNNAKDVTVAYDLPITVKFSAPMDAAAVREAISISPATPFTMDMGKGAGPGADDDSLVIRLSNESSQNPIQFGALYRVTVAATAANMDGITMAEPYTFSFRTANPGVIQTYPVNGASRVVVDQVEYPVLFNFNTRLDPDTINDRNIRVKPDNGISVATTYTDSNTNGWTTVRVATQWQPNTAYTITVSRRVKALNGQSLGNTPFTLQFRTAPNEIITMPIIEKRR